MLAVSVTNGSDGLAVLIELEAVEHMESISVAVPLEAQAVGGSVCGVFSDDAGVGVLPMAVGVSMISTTDWVEELEEEEEEEEEAVLAAVLS